MTLRILVVDDEQLARDELCYLLGDVADVAVAGQAANGVEAIRLAAQLKPDAVLLDIQMPGMGGFHVARSLLERVDAPQIVFVTAFDQYAVEAFEVNAADYLMKPVDPGRLEQALQRVRQRRDAGRHDGSAGLTADDLARIVQAIADRQSRRDRLALKVGDRFLLVHADEVIHASLVDDTIQVATSQLTGTSNYRTLDELQAHLDPAVFWRVHRSHLVNINKIKEIVPWFSRNYILRMRDPKTTEIPVSRAQTRRLREYLKL
jgi:two-component system LytT family response regulator/two-component system response regulator LytT